MSELDKLEAQRDAALLELKAARKRLRRWQTSFDGHLDRALRLQDAIAKLQSEAKAIARRLHKSK